MAALWLSLESENARAFVQTLISHRVLRRMQLRQVNQSTFDLKMMAACDFPSIEQS